MDQRRAQLCDIVGRDTRRHAHGNAACSVGQKIGEARWQHHRFRFRAVVGVAEIDDIVVESVKQGHRYPGQARLGVAHGRGIVAVDIAEVALAVNQRVARRKLLGETHEGVVDGLVAVGMVLADDITHHARRLLESLIRIEAELPHGIEYPPMDRLEAVPDVRQRARRDGRHRVSEIALRERISETDSLDGAIMVPINHDSRVPLYVVGCPERTSTKRCRAGGSPVCFPRPGHGARESTRTI